MTFANTSVDPKVLACVSAEHGMEENQPIFNAASHVSKNNAHMHTLCCWQFELSWYLSDDPDTQPNEPSREEIKEVLAEIRNDLNDRYELTSFGNRIHIKAGDPAKLIPSYCSEHKMDVAIMSSASLDHPLGRLLGSTIEQTITKLPCALMVVKPIGFKSPVSVESTAFRRR